jgi:signal peptidase I
MATSAEKRTAFFKDLRQLIVICAVIVGGRSVLADWYVVPTGSMKPTILEGDRVFVWKSAYQVRVPLTHIKLFSTGAPHRRDVVVVRNPDGGRIPFVKRLIGLPGDAVELRNEQLFVNGKPQKTDFLPAVSSDNGEPVLLGTEHHAARPHPIRVLPARNVEKRNFGPITVPADEVLLMGDNRDESRDGRYFGTRPKDDLLGRAVGVMWSWNPKWLEGPRLKRFARAFISEAQATTTPN